MKKTFLKAIAIAAAFLMANSTAVTLAAETVQTETLSATQLYASKTTKSKYNDNEGYTVLDKWGNAYPYSYYYYAEKSLEKGKEYLLQDYIWLYNYIHENRYTYQYSKFRILFKLTSPDPETELGEVLTMLHNMDDCPTMYFIYAAGFSAKYPSGNDKTLVSLYTSTRCKAGETKSYDKNLAAANADFQAYLKEKKAKTSKDFYRCAADYIAKTVKKGDPLKGGSLLKTAVGGLVLKKGNFAGHTNAFGYLCVANQMPVAQTAGEAYGGWLKGGGFHGWAKVPINNVWQVVDATFYKVDGTSAFITDKEYFKMNKAKEATSTNVYPAANGKKTVPKLPSKEPEALKFSVPHLALKAADSTDWGVYGDYAPTLSIYEAYKKGYDCIYAPITDHARRSKEDRLSCLKIALEKPVCKPYYDHFEIKNDTVFVYYTKESFEVETSKKGKGRLLSFVDTLKFRYYDTVEMKSIIADLIAQGYSYFAIEYDDCGLWDGYLEITKENIEKAKEEGVITYDHLEVKNNRLYVYLEGGSSSSDDTKTDNSKKGLSVTIKSDSLKTYEAFKKALNSAVKKAQDGGYGYLTLKNSDTAALEKYLKQAKEDGVISYASLKVLDAGIRIKF